MLVNDEHLSAIQYVTLGNESNSYEDKIPIERYDQCYLLLDRELKRVGLRDHIRIISGDLVATNQERWFANLGDKLADISDGYSAHMYWSYWDTEKLLRRVSEVPQIVGSLPAKAQRPLYITEFGVRGFQQGSDEPGYVPLGVPVCDTPMQATQIAWLMVEAINRGYVATVQWDCYDAWYDRLMHFGLIGDVKSKWKIRPAYDVLRLFTHTTQPGWRTVRIEGKTQKIGIAGLRSDAGDLAVYVLNRSDVSETIRVHCGEKMFETRWLNGRLDHPREIRDDQNGVIEISLPPMSLVALTTIRPNL